MKYVYREMENTARVKITGEMQKRLAKRRLVWPENGMNLHLLPPHDLGRRAIVLTWIDKNTTNRFYLGGRQIVFENEKDEVLFKLGFKL